MSELRHFEAGQRARDRESEDGSEVLVLGAKDATAEECYVAAIEQTIAEANPEYPVSDAVADVAFVEGIENALGLDWSAGDVLELYADGELDRARIKAYGYPESRLAPIEGDDAENTGTDGRSFRTREKEKPRQSPRKIDRPHGGEEENDV